MAFWMCLQVWSTAVPCAAEVRRQPAAFQKLKRQHSRKRDTVEGNALPYFRFGLIRFKLSLLQLFFCDLATYPVYCPNECS